MAFFSDGVSVTLIVVAERTPAHSERADPKKSTELKPLGSISSSFVCRLRRGVQEENQSTRLRPQPDVHGPYARSLFGLIKRSHTFFWRLGIFPI